jgi:hypothetical protein
LLAVIYDGVTALIADIAAIWSCDNTGADAMMRACVLSPAARSCGW